MRELGYVVLIVGFIGLVFGLNYDTSVALESGYRINNIGLLNDKQNILIVSGILAVVGAILVSSGKATSVDAQELVATPRDRAANNRRERKQLNELGITFDGEHYYIREFRFTEAEDAIAKAKQLAIQDDPA